MMQPLHALSPKVLFSADKPKETAQQAITRQALKYAQGKTILSFQTSPTETKTWNLYQALTWVKATFPQLPVTVKEFKNALKDKLFIPSNQAERAIALMGQNPSFFDPGQSGMRAQRLASSYPEHDGNLSNWKDVFAITNVGEAVIQTPADNADPQPFAQAAKAYSAQLAQNLPSETTLAQSITLATPKAEALGKKGTLIWRAHDQLGLMGKLLEKTEKFDENTQPGLSVPDITKGLKALAKFSTADMTKVLADSLAANNGQWVRQITIAKRPHYTLTPQGWNLAKAAPDPLFQSP